jgi:hypothetical protein
MTSRFTILMSWIVESIRSCGASAAEAGSPGGHQFARILMAAPT